MKPTPETTTQKLDRLADWQAKRDVLNMAKQDMIDEILTPELKAQIESIEFEFAPQYEALDTNLAELEAEIKAEVITQGETVRGKLLMAVYNKGRVSWDGKKLDGMMAIIPSIKDARKEGDPSITMRRL